MGSSVSIGANFGGGSGHLLGTRASSSGDAAPSISDVSGVLGAGALIGSSVLGVGDGTLPKKWKPWGPSWSPISQSPY